MPTPTYDNSTDGELIVKASAMFAAFNAYHQKYLQDKTAVMHYRGSVANMTALYALLDDPNVDLTDGDVYNVIATGENFAYVTPTGSGTHEDADYWDNLGSVVDLTGYATETWVNNKFANSVSFGGNVSVAGTLSSTGNISSGGEISATETVDGQTVTHNLTDKLDTDDYHAAYTWGEAGSKFTWDSIKGGHSTAQDTYTTNLNLVKPGLGTQIDVTDLNNNFDILDANAKVRVSNGSGTSVSVNQLTFLDNANSIWKYLDEVRLYNGTDALYCKTGVTTGLLMQDNKVKVINVTWNNGVPAVGTLKGYISADGDYHIWDATANSGAGADSTSLATLRDSVSTSIKNITRSGTTFTATKNDGTSFTFTQQDNNTTYSNVSKSAAGLCPQLPNETTTTKYLRQDGSWQVPPDNNTTYSASTSYGVTMSGTQIRRYSNVLYNNASGSSGTITLSSSAANYNHICIYFIDNDDNPYPRNSSNVYSPNGNIVSLTINHSNSSNAYCIVRIINISGTSIANYKEWYGYAAANGNNGFTHKQTVSIIRVEAWNE